MANDYLYYWDTANKKKVYGGKYGNSTAGQRHYLKKKNWGVDREFKGSGIQPYKFYDPKTNITVTISAKTQAEANQIAKSMGLRQKKRG